MDMIYRISACTCFLLFINAQAFCQLKSRTEIEEEKVRLTYARNRARGVQMINQRFLVQFEAAQKAAFQNQNLEDAKNIEKMMKKLQSEIDFIRKTQEIRKGRIPLNIVVESFNDGADEFHVTKHGVKWVNQGMAKAGRHMGQDEPTFLNGTPWKPNWDEGKKERGNDVSATHRIEMIPELLRYELLSIGNHRGSVGIEERSPTSGHYDEGDKVFIVSIPDSQGSSRWYRFRVYYVDLINFSSELKFPDLSLEEFKSYQRTLSSGILKLNQTHISSLMKLKNAYTKEGNIEKAENLAKLVERLKVENTRLHLKE